MREFKRQTESEEVPQQGYLQRKGDPSRLLLVILTIMGAVLIVGMLLLA